MRNDSEVRWVPVGELGEVRMGKQLSPASRSAGHQIPYLRVANVFEDRIDYKDVKTMGFSVAEQEVYGLRPGDILLNEGQESLSMVGRSAVYEGEPNAYCFQNTLVRFRPGPDVIPRYAQLVFMQWRRDGVFARVAEKTSISHLGGRRLARLNFPLIPIVEQERVIDVLDGIADAEHVTRSAVQKLRVMRQGTVCSFMAAVGSLEIPPGWERVPLKEVVPSVDYGVSAALGRDPVGIPTLRMNNLRHGKPELAELRYCSAPVPGHLKLRAGDVLFNRTNSIDHVGRSGIWSAELPDATFASYLVRLNPDLSRITREYLVEWLGHPIVRQRVRSIATVAVQQVNVNPSRLREINIDFPLDRVEQRCLTTTLAACDERIAREEEELDKLHRLKWGIADDLLRRQS